MVTPQATGFSSGRGSGLWLKKSWVNTISALTISLLVALEDGRSVSKPLPSQFFREILEIFVTIQKRGGGFVGRRTYLHFICKV
jgi:hypothetical protein